MQVLMTRQIIYTVYYEHFKTKALLNNDYSSIPQIR